MDPIDKGWVKDHRSVVKWRWFTYPLTAHLFRYLVLEANTEDMEFRDTVIKRGQLVVGLHKLAKATGLSVQQVRTSLKRLSENKKRISGIERTFSPEISLKSTNKYTIITILNYEKYQHVPELVQQTSNNQITNNQQGLKNKRIKEVKDYSAAAPPKNGNNVVKDVILRLNEKSGKFFKYTTPGHAKFINARMKEGHKLEDFSTVIDYKCREWKNDPKMHKFLRPKTLFNSENFDSYLNEAREPGNAQPKSRWGKS